MINTFQEKGYVLVKSFLSKELCDYLYSYCKMRARTGLLLKKYYPDYRKSIDGHFDDPQAIGDYSCYSDPAMETILNRSVKKIEQMVGVQLVPTYTFWRLYTNGSELKKHTDRESCEISTTLCIGYESDYCWPMFVNGEPLETEPGDMILYKGVENSHWREPFRGKFHAQAFLHFNEKDGKYNNEFDGRPCLGVPSNLRIEK